MDSAISTIYYLHIYLSTGPSTTTQPGGSASSPQVRLNLLSTEMRFVKGNDECAFLCLWPAERRRCCGVVLLAAECEHFVLLQMTPSPCPPSCNKTQASSSRRNPAAITVSRYKNIWKFQKLLKLKNNWAPQPTLRWFSPETVHLYLAVHHFVSQLCNSRITYYCYNFVWSWCCSWKEIGNWIH